jgi:hypothetical protein
VIYPNDADVILLLCEDARLEIGNKITIIGWYVGGDILIPQPNPQPVLQSLCLIFHIRSGDGEFSVSTKVIDPNGTTIVETQVSKISINRGSATAQILKLVPFSSLYGRYNVELYLEEKAYRRQFAVAAQEAL